MSVGRRLLKLNTKNTLVLLNGAFFCAGILLLICLLPAVDSIDTSIRKFEYKYSFKPPYLAQKDGSVPFWEHHGNAIASEENLRITPSLRSQKGSIWTKHQTDFEFWEVEMTFRVTGRGRVGADGLAFWFTETPGPEGPVFGSSDMWKGLGVFFDSFDNDNKHNNPYIMAMVNDGTKQYDHQNDGSTQQLAGCLRDFRNKPFPVRAKIHYYKNVLSLLFNNGMSNNEGDYEMCLRVENVVLPPRGYFGISAATGGLADDHDVQKFMTWSLSTSPSEASGFAPPPHIPNPDQQKFEQEFQTYQKELDRKKEEYVKEHPEAANAHKEEEDWFEEEQIRELRQIFQGQSEVRAMIQGLGKKLDEIVGRQETTISLVSQQQQQVGVQQPMGGPPPPVGASPLQRHEVESILASNRELVQNARDIKNILSSISAKQDQIAARPASYGTATAADYTPNFNEIRDSLNIVKRDVSLVSQRVHSPVAAPQAQVTTDCPACLSPTLFIGLAVVQLVILLGYSIYKSSKDNQAKKFY